MKIFKEKAQQYARFELSKKESKEIFVHRGKTSKRIHGILCISHLDEIYQDIAQKVHGNKLDTPHKLEAIRVGIQDFYLYLSSLFSQSDDIQISIPEQLRKLSDKYKTYDYIICGDNPGTTEYQKHVWFNAETQNGEYLRSLFPGKILFFNKTFISTAITSQLFEEIDQELLKKSLEFNAKILNLLVELTQKPLVIVGWNALRDSEFESFFSHLTAPHTVSPHSSRSMIFRAQSEIPGWNKQFEKFLTHPDIIKIRSKILTEKGNLSYKHINEKFSQEQKKHILGLYRDIVILAKK